MRRLYSPIPLPTDHARRVDGSLSLLCSPSPVRILSSRTSAAVARDLPTFAQPLGNLVEPMQHDVERRITLRSDEQQPLIVRRDVV